MPKLSNIIHMVSSSNRSGRISFTDKIGVQPSMGLRINFQDMLEYKKVYDYITESWVLRPFETDPSRVEYSVPGEAKLRAIGMYKGMKAKSWNELTPEEQALFLRDDEDITSS